MDDDRDEIVHGYVEDLVDSADWKDHGEPEMDEDLQRMRELAGLVDTDEGIVLPSGKSGILSEPQFKYDKSLDHETNYSVWRSMNDKEYRNNKQQPKSPEESRREFERQFSKFGNSKTKKPKGDDGSAEAFKRMMKAGEPRGGITIK
jgi:hypothetical protein